MLPILVGGWLCVACGGAPEMNAGAQCGEGDFLLQIESGHPLSTPDGCAQLLAKLRTYRSEYETRFGRQALWGYPVRLRTATDLRDTGIGADYAVSGHTYGDAIDLAKWSWTSFPHELNHVRTGSGHGGWCQDYEPWSEDVLGINQRRYLGCE